MERRRTAVGGALALAVLVGAAIAATTIGDAPRPSPTPSSPTAPVPPPSPTPDTDTATATIDGSPSDDGAIVVWARGELTDEIAVAMSAAPRVVAAAHVRSDTLGLVGSRNADGTPRDVLNAGFRIPVEVAAIDPAALVATLPPGDAPPDLGSLAAGRALLSETAARLRGVGVGGTVDLVGLPGIEVVGVVPDGTVGRAEIVLHRADADAAGLERDGSVYLRHVAAPGPETAALVARLHRLVPDDLTARVVDVRAGLPRRRAPLVLSTAQVKERFGEFAFRPRSGVREIDIDPAFPAEHIVTADVPILGSVTCHEDIIEDLRSALDRIADAGLAEEIDPSTYAGCYYPRTISVGGDRLSHHAWGIALDINVDLSLPDLGPPPHPGVIAAFEANGFRWGGDFLHPDNHHFEWVGQEITGGR